MKRPRALAQHPAVYPLCPTHLRLAQHQFLQHGGRLGREVQRARLLHAQAGHVAQVRKRARRLLRPGGGARAGAGIRWSAAHSSPCTPHTASPTPAPAASSPQAAAHLEEARALLEAWLRLAVRLQRLLALHRAQVERHGRLLKAQAGRLGALLRAESVVPAWRSGGRGGGGCTGEGRVGGRARWAPCTPASDRWRPALPHPRTRQTRRASGRGRPTPGSETPSCCRWGVGLGWWSVGSGVSGSVTSGLSTRQLQGGQRR